MTQGWKAPPDYRRYRVPFQLGMYGLSVAFLAYLNVPLLQSLLFGILVSFALQVVMYFVAMATGVGFLVIKDAGSWLRNVPDMTVRDATKPLRDFISAVIFFSILGGAFWLLYRLGPN